MTWVELRNWAVEEEHRLHDLDYWHGVEWPGKETIGLWLKRHDSTIDISVEHFLETGTWGELARDDRAGLFYRIAWATQLLTMLTFPLNANPPIVPNPTATRREVLHWVLIDSWHPFGRFATGDRFRWNRYRK